MIVSAWKAFWRLFGFYKEPRSYFDHIPAPTDAQLVRWGEGARNVANDPEYKARAAQGALNMAPAAVKNRRLAEIARERAWVYANKDELLSKRKGFYVRLRALKNAEMAVEQGKPEPGK